jgi:4-hydroxy-3-methylbut-2-enyl diphosphate reductase
MAPEMGHSADIRRLYRGTIISRVKESRRLGDPRRHDLSPSVLDFGPVRFVLARHFGFCFGVENAVEIAYETLEANPGRRIFFLSEMIHNPKVNGDLRDRGVRFIFSPTGEQLVPWDELTPDDIVVVPAFGTTLEMEETLARRGIDPYRYNTTCPFVEKVWKRSAQLGEQKYTVIVHGKATHEETRATFSHSVRSTPTVVVLDLKEAVVLADIIRGRSGRDTFEKYFGHKCSEGFDPDRDLARIGVVNQTTMLAAETREISRILREAMTERYGRDRTKDHFADTSDTLCYATNENQNATYALVERGADIALVVGGYNSSNTSHIVDLCQETLPTYFIENESEIVSEKRIRHFSLEEKRTVETEDWLPSKRPVDIILTCGASCPDAVLDDVLFRVLSFFRGSRPIGEVMAEYPQTTDSPRPRNNV